ncbi:hypothetical protein C8Q75DRAFT_824675 [Abortiporus biennis]|nr:hypothetical protein C8Q75DRAFT_824675 [Abortiporus biennis]
MLDLANNSPSRNAAELKSLLGNSNSKLKHGAKIIRTDDCIRGKKSSLQSQMVVLEQARSKARVEVDIILSSDTFVQGGEVSGHIKFRIRKRSKKDDEEGIPPVLLSDGKVRIVGFETIPQSTESYTFYQSAKPLSEIVEGFDDLFDWEEEGGELERDEDGFGPALEGTHILPFRMNLPLNSTDPGTVGSAKGTLDIQSGVVVRYVAMVSIKVKDPKTSKCSLAHFYRNVSVYPSLNLASILSAAPKPLQASTSKSLSVLPTIGSSSSSSSSDKVKLTATLQRLHWIAGQKVHVNIFVDNETKKTVKSVTLTLVRTTTLFKPSGSSKFEDGDGGDKGLDEDACQTSTTHKAVAEEILEMGQGGAKGYASAKGWWTGVGPGQKLEFSHFILLPPDALSITRGRLLEVEYSLQVTLSAGSLTADVFVTLPLRIVNFISLDPLNTVSSSSSSHPSHSAAHHSKTSHRTTLPNPSSVNHETGNSSFSSSTSNSSISSTEGNVGHSPYSQPSSHSHKSRHQQLPLANFNLPSSTSNMSTISDEDRAEIDFVVGSARLEHDHVGYDNSRRDDFESTSRKKKGKGKADILASPSGNHSGKGGRRMEGIGLTSFAMRVEEKRALRYNGALRTQPTSKLSSSFSASSLDRDEGDEATPRMEDYHRDNSLVSGLPADSLSGLIRQTRSQFSQQTQTQQALPPRINVQTTTGGSNLNSYSNLSANGNTHFEFNPSNSFESIPPTASALMMNSFGYESGSHISSSMNSYSHLDRVQENGGGGSRILPRIPDNSNNGQVHKSKVVTTTTTNAIDSGSSKHSKVHSHSLPRPPSLDRIQVQEQRRYGRATASGVKGRIAAFEQQMKRSVA